MGIRKERLVKYEVVGDRQCVGEVGGEIFCLTGVVGIGMVVVKERVVGSGATVCKVVEGLPVLGGVHW